MSVKRRVRNGAVHYEASAVVNGVYVSYGTFCTRSAAEIALKMKETSRRKAERLIGKDKVDHLYLNGLKVIRVNQPC